MMGSLGLVGLYNSGEVADWPAMTDYLKSLPKGDYLLHVVNRQKGSKKTHDLYTAVCDIDSMIDKVSEVDVLARYVWSQEPDVTPVVYMSNVRIDQEKGYELLLRGEAAKLLQGKSIKARMLSTTKPAYLGMYRDYTTMDLDVPLSEDLEDVRERVLNLRDDLVATGYEVRLRKTSGGYHVTVSNAHNGNYRLMKALELYGLDKYRDKGGRDVVSPLVGVMQKETVVKLL